MTGPPLPEPLDERRPAMLADVPDILPLVAVPFIGDGWHVTWSAVTAAAVCHRRLPSGTSRTRYLGVARTPAELAGLVRDCARHLAATRPCPTGKVRFRTEADAVGALARSILSHSAKRREQRRYRCDDCGDWHLTSLSTWRTR